MNFSALGRKKKKRGKISRAFSFVKDFLSVGWKFFLVIWHGFWNDGSLESLEILAGNMGLQPKNLTTSPPLEAKHPKKSQSHERRKGRPGINNHVERLDAEMVQAA